VGALDYTRSASESAARTFSTEPGPRDERRLTPLALAALGVVFGDIGTSPLYAFKLCFTSSGFEPSPTNVLGILSLITWALILVVCVKYASVVLRADNDGEGGTLALLAQLLPTGRVGIPPPLTIVAYMLLFAAGMVLGDGVITPAISVLSAVEGAGVVATAAQPFIVPITIAILIALFAIQSRGTGRIGAIFGPVMALWFVSIDVAGTASILHRPAVLRALNPAYALDFVGHYRIAAILTLGAVVLCVTGVEAMFADLAHFGRRAICVAWYVVALPALLLNYYGQAALTLARPAALEHPFFLLYPAWATLPMVVLATAATVIASQALITGAFSLTQQAVQLGYLPRLRVMHTSHKIEGQIFMPLVNALLAIACIALVLLFRSSERLGAAYGLAVTMTMLTDSLVIGLVLRRRFRWPLARIVPLVALFLVVDLSFLVGNLPKLPQGGYVPVAIAVAIFLIFTTWTAGRRRLALAFAALSTPVADFVREVGDRPPRFEDGTAIFLTPHTDGIPFALRHHWLRTRILREEVVLLTIVTHRRPYVGVEQRVEVERIVPRLTRITANYGFMDTPDVLEVLRCCQPELPPEINLAEADYFFARPRIAHEHGTASGFPGWRRWLLSYMMRNATPLTDSLGIPPDRIIEFGVTLQL
jgi:KUP system potassium uptake protein